MSHEGDRGFIHFSVCSMSSPKKPAAAAAKNAPKGEKKEVKSKATSTTAAAKSPKKELKAKPPASVCPYLLPCVTSIAADLCMYVSLQPNVDLPQISSEMKGTPHTAHVFALQLMQLCAFCIHV